MLGAIRKFSTSIYAKILLGIVVIPFVFWGMGSTFRGGNKNVIVVIDKEKFSIQEFANFVNSYQNNQQKVNAEDIDELLSIFIGDKLLENELNNFDIKLSDISLSKLIKIQKEFNKENEFSRTEYEKFLILNNLNAVSFEKQLGDQEKRKQLLNFVGGGIVPTKFMVNDIYNKINQKRNIEFINLNDAFKNEFIFTDNEIKNYYENNKDKYIENYKSVKILEINPKKLIGTDDFNNIFFKKLDEIHDLIIQGEKLNPIIKQYNLDNAEIIKINKFAQDLNYKEIDNFSKNLLDKIFLLPKDQPTAFLEEEDKFYIIEIFKNENIEKKITDVNVVKNIKNSLITQKKRKLMSEIIAKINQKKFFRQDFYKFAKSKNAIVQKITLDNLNDNKILNKMIISQIYAFPEKKVIVSNDIELKENFLIYIDKITNASIDENSKDYDKYFKLAKINMTNKLFNTYDKYIKEKYKIDINYKALSTVKNYIN